MNAPAKRRTIRRINTDVSKCIGCRACEVACSGFHATPRYGNFNPARSRVRVAIEILRDIYVPVRGGYCVRAECNGRVVYQIGGKEYSECAFCGASCPSRDLFKEPDSGLPLKCDMCEDADSPVPEPLCVQVCRVGALAYEEYEEESEAVAKPESLEKGLDSLLDRHGLQKVTDAFTRIRKAR